MDIIHRLRRKFLFLAFIAVVLILAGALGLINTITYMKMRGEVDTLLDVIVQNDGVLPGHQPGTSTQSWLSDPEWYNDTPEFAHQTRYFSVVLDEKGEIQRLNLSNISAFTELQALEIASRLAETDASQPVRGMFKNKRASYAYEVSGRDAGGKLVVVMDCTRDVGAVEAFSRYSLRFGLVCVILYLLVLGFLSNYAIRPFVENMESQKRFITNAGHELKTPVAIISANAEALELISGKSQWTDNILVQVKRVTRLINELIMLARMGEKNQKQLKLEPVDVSRCFTDAVHSFAPLVENEKKKLESQIPEGIEAESDPKYLYEIFTIFMDNAAKYCDDSGTIRAVLEPHGKKGFRALVSNDYKNGAGQDYTHFFERFYRGDESHNSQKAGYGIGLSMAQEATRLLGGKIQVEYRDGVITFGVSF
ncbi:MAG: HAMP domain-containing sensor histidine kinase [Acidaminococcus sp.]|uniref:sensor histidine kinase n=1 Tax=Acidaminococcus sp. TaxID=1872103 RepID=UPI0026DEC98B|nr:HAMP domain-containing sensor histidine kinase [Acidaminococcus sp.]MDO5596827.1 HAMP domain-containing sensor histidine kinase [Acidaminococcus sp.]